MKTLEERIQEVRDHERYVTSRGFSTLLEMLELGLRLNKDARTFFFVYVEAYKKGKEKQPARIINEYRRGMKWLRNKFSDRL